MLKRKGWKRLLSLLAVFVFALALTACGGGDDDDMDDDEMDDAGESTLPVEEDDMVDEDMPTSSALPLAQGSTVIGRDIETAAGDDLAEVNEVLFDQEGNIQYVVLDINESEADFPYYAFEWDGFAISPADSQANLDSLLYEADSLGLEDALGLEEATLDGDDLFFEAAASAGANTELLNDLLRLSAFSNFELFDYDLIAAGANEDIGEVEELLVNMGAGTVTYAVADIGGWLGIDETMTTIPWNAIDFNTQEDNFVINASEQELRESPVLEPEGLDQLDDIDPQWFEELEAYWENLEMEAAS